MTTDRRFSTDRSAVGPAAAVRFHSIDALRGLAAVLVLVFHLFRNSPQTVVLDSVMPGPVVTLLDYSRNGVAIFFVISGFVIAYSTRALGTHLRDAGVFTLRRQLRLDPPYYVVIAVVVAKGIVESQVPGLVVTPVTLPQVLVNMVYLQDITGQPAILAVAWSLCLEVQFYLVVVLMTLVVGRLARSAEARHRVTRAMAFTMGVVSLALPLFQVSAGPWFIGLWWMFSLGMALCWFMLGRLSRFGIVVVVVVTGMGCVAVDLVPGAISDPWHGQWAAWLTAVAILVLILTKRVAQPVPKVVLWLGAVSYSLYLVHLPVIDTVVAGLWKVTPHSVLMAVAGVVVGAAISLAAAALLRRWVEVPALSWSHRVRARAARTPTADPR